MFVSGPRDGPAGLRALLAARDLDRARLVAGQSGQFHVGTSCMEFTGERMVPGSTPVSVVEHHVDRYAFAQPLALGARILDVACGVGYGTDMLKRSGAKLAVGVDICREAVMFAHLTYGSAGTLFVIGDAVELPFSDGAFDLTVSFETIEHVPIPADFLSEVYRTLSRYGTLIISTPNRRVWSPGSVGRMRPTNPFHVHEFEQLEFHALLRRFFPLVGMFAQNELSSMRYLVDYSPLARVVRPLRSLAARGPERGTAPRRRICKWQPGSVPRYLVAVCSKKPSASP